jgi:hypothetical protein
LRSEGDKLNPHDEFQVICVGTMPSRKGKITPHSLNMGCPSKQYSMEVMARRVTSQGRS